MKQYTKTTLKDLNDLKPLSNCQAIKGGDETGKSQTNVDKHDPNGNGTGG
jgi:hypothetical protein